MSKPIHPLRRWLFEHQETAIAFSARAGLTNSYLSEVLNGYKRPSLDMIDKITLATKGGVTADDFQNLNADTAP